MTIQRLPVACPPQRFCPPPARGVFPSDSAVRVPSLRSNTWVPMNSSSARSLAGTSFKIQWFAGAGPCPRRSTPWDKNAALPEPCGVFVGFLRRLPLIVAGILAAVEKQILRLPLGKAQGRSGCWQQPPAPPAMRDRSRLLIADPSTRSARSGFRLRAPAALTPANRLNFHQA